VLRARDAFLTVRTHLINNASSHSSLPARTAGAHTAVSLCPARTAPGYSERSPTRSCRTSVLRYSIGNNDCGSTRPSRASLLASSRSFLRLRRFVPSISRGLATSTSCPQPTTTSRTQAECVPTSKITRAADSAPKNAATSSRAVRNCPTASVSPSSPKMQ
jgi:hypothetical protein